MAHQLLVKIYPGHHGLLWAAMKMCQSSKTTQRSNRVYGWLKRQLSEAAKARVGAKNGAFGTIWVNNPTTGEAAKIRGGDAIPDGWEIGRVTQNKCVSCGAACKKSKYCEPHALEARVKACVRNGSGVIKKGLVYINNGSTQRRHDPTHQLPEGFVLGGLPRKRKRKRKR